MKRMISLLSVALLSLFVIGILFLSVRGNGGNPTETDLTKHEWQSGGPFELSPERGRFALLYSLVENKSFYFSLPLARFTVPDLGYKNNQFVSLFAPGVSYIAVPGYLIGRWLGNSQVGAFLVISLFALGNFLLIRGLAIRLGAFSAASTLAALAFLFATPAYNYAITLYQHHVSTFIVLLALYLILESRRFFRQFFFWFLFAVSVPVDYPNLFFLLPMALWVISNWAAVSVKDSYAILKPYIGRMLALTGVTIPLLFFFWFNTQSYGNPLQFSGTVSSVRDIDASGKPTDAVQISRDNADRYLEPAKKTKSATGFFTPRKLLNGLYIHIISPDRGLIYFAPVVLLGIFGLYEIYKKNRRMAIIIVATIWMILLLYSMWGDPWGGWAFGSRYLIPAYALLSLGVAFSLSRYRRNILVVGIFVAVLYYSIIVNTAGALSSHANPPQVEVLNLEKLSGKVQKYTYERNLDYLKAGDSKSFVYRSWAKHVISAWEYYLYISWSIAGVCGLLVLVNIFSRKGPESHG